MYVIVFGSRNLKPVHIRPLYRRLLAIAAMVSPDEQLVLVHGDGPPGQKTPGAVGADKLAEVAAHAAWAGRDWKPKRYGVYPKEGQTWAAAALERNRTMAFRTPTPYLAECFHTDASLGRGSAHMARQVKERGVNYRLTLLGPKGEVLLEEER